MHINGSRKHHVHEGIEGVPRLAYQQEGRDHFVVVFYSHRRSKKVPQTHVRVPGLVLRARVREATEELEEEPRVDVGRRLQKRLDSPLGTLELSTDGAHAYS